MFFVSQLSFFFSLLSHFITGSSIDSSFKKKIVCNFLFVSSICLFFLYSSITFFTLLLVADAALSFKDQCVKWHNEYRSRHQVNYYKPVFKNLSCKQSKTARNRNFKLSLLKRDSRFLLNHL